MSVKLSLLALLAEAPRYGYELKAEFERRTGDTWPLNVGQVYTTLDRLTRDGLVIPSEQDDAGHLYYALTDAGRDAVAGWWAAPVEPATPPRDELAIKLALAVTAPGVDVEGVLSTQRAATMRAMQALNGRKRRTADLSERLVVESLLFAAEAQVRWLDHCERVLTLTPSTPGTPGTPEIGVRP